jgi:L-malate glycosyltransferase
VPAHVPSPVRRVFFLLDSLQIGGTETQAVELARRLDSERYQVTLGCLRLEGPLLETLQGSLVSVVEFCPRGGVNSPGGAYQMLRLAWFLRRHHFDVVHTHDLWSNLLGIPSARMARVPVLISSRRDLSHLSWYTPGRRRILRHLQNLSSVVLANSGEVREHLMRDDQFRPDQIEVIRNGVDVERFQVKRERLRFFPGLDRHKLVVLVGNMLSRIKGHLCLLSAASRIDREFPDARFVFLGDGPERGMFEHRAQELGIGGKVLFLGRRGDIAPLLVCCDIAVLPSEAESLPNALLEYLAAGLPTVASDVGGNSEIVEHGRTGLLVAPQDPEALAEAILCLLRDPGAARQLGSAGREHVRKHFSFERLVAEIDGLYTRLLEQGVGIQTSNNHLLSGVDSAAGSSRLPH